MRIQKITVAAVVALAASLSLTACDSGGSNDSSAGATSSATTTATTAPQDSADSSSGSSDSTATPQPNSSVSGQGVAATTEPDTNSSGGGACQTSHLSFRGTHGMGEGDILIDLTNTGAGTCTMHGFPGVDLKGKDGTVSAARSKVAAPDVTLRSGQSTRFTLHYPPNNSGGSGVTFTSLIVTPPNETHSHTMDLSINIPVGDSAGPAITVDPVGAGK